MLLNYSTQNSQDAAANDYLNDKLDPDFMQTAGAGFLSGFSSPFAALSDVASDLTGDAPSKEGQSLQESADVFNQISSAGNGVASFVGNAAGMLLNPAAVIPAEKAGEVLFDGASKLLSYSAPALADATIMPGLSVGTALARGVQGAAVGGIANLAPSVVSSYNLDSHKIDWGGVAKGVAMGSAFGVALSPIAMAYGVLKYRKSIGQPITDAEEAAISQPLDEHITTDPVANAQKAAQATDIINKYVDNPNLDIDGDTANIKLFENDDIANVQSTIADMLSAKEEIDPTVLKSALGNTIKNVVQDGQLSGALDETQKAVADIQNKISANLMDTIEKRAPKLKASLQKVVPGISTDEDAVQTLLDKTKHPFLRKQIASVKSSPENFTPRIVQHANEVSHILDMQELLTHYNDSNKIFDTLRDLGTDLPNQAEANNNLQNYFNGAASDAAPLPKVEEEGADNTSVSQQKIERQVTLDSDESMQPEDVEKDSKGLSEAINRTQKAIESLKNNKKVLAKLVNCVLENK